MFPVHNLILPAVSQESVDIIMRTGAEQAT